MDNSLVKQFGIVRAGSQRLQVRFWMVPSRAEKSTAGNILIGKMETDKMFRCGDKVFLVVTTIGNEITTATAYDHYRLNIQAALIAMFAVALIGFTGWSGAKALLSLFFTVVCMWKILLPGILMGIRSDLDGFSGGHRHCRRYAIFDCRDRARTALVAWFGALLGIIFHRYAGIITLSTFPLTWGNSAIFRNPALFRFRKSESGAPLYCRRFSRGVGRRH